jgi:hypothetical protein
MTRRSDRLTRIEQALTRLEEAVGEHATFLRSQGSAIRAEVKFAKSSAESAHVGVQALADMLAASKTIPEAAPHPPPVVQPAADDGTVGEPDAVVRRAPKTLREKGM